MQFWIWVVLGNPHEQQAHKIQLTTYMIMYHHHLFLDIARNAATGKMHRKPEIFTCQGNVYNLWQLPRLLQFLGFYRALVFKFKLLQGILQ